MWDFGTTGQSHHLRATSGFVTYPFTMAIWVYFHDVVTSQTVFAQGRTTTGAKYTGVGIRNDGLARAIDYGGVFKASFAGSVSANQWHHIAGVFTSVTSRLCYLDGVAGTTSTGTSSDGTASPNHLTVGHNGRSGSKSPLDGLACVPCVYDRALSAVEIAALAAGHHPRLVAPASLHRVLDATDENSLVDSRGDTWATSGVSWSGSPPPGIVYPSRGPLYVPPTAVGPSAAQWFFRNHILRRRAS